MKDKDLTLEEANEIAEEVLGKKEPAQTNSTEEEAALGITPLQLGGEYLVSRVIFSLGFKIEELAILNDANEQATHWKGKVEGIPVSGAYRTDGDERYQALAIAFSFAMNMHPGSDHFLWMADAMQYQFQGEPNTSSDIAMRKILSTTNQGPDILLLLEKRYKIRETFSKFGLFQASQKKA